MWSNPQGQRFRKCLQLQHGKVDATRSLDNAIIGEVGMVASLTDATEEVSRARWLFGEVTMGLLRRYIRCWVGNTTFLSQIIEFFVPLEAFAERLFFRT